MIKIPRSQLHKKDYTKLKSLVSAGTVASFILLFITIVILSKNLPGHNAGAHTQFYKNAAALYLFLYIPLIILSWLCLGQVGGILIFVFSCLSIIYIVLKHFVLSYNGYIFLFGIAAVVGYRLFLKNNSEKNRYLISKEAREGAKNSLVTDIAKKEAKITTAKNRVIRYLALKDITEDLSSTLELSKTAEVITDKTFNVVGNSDRSLLYLINEQKQELELFSCRQAAGYPQIQTKRPELFDTWLLKQRRSLIVEDLDSDFRFSSGALRDPSSKNFKSIIGVPLMNEMRVIGTLRLESSKKAAYTQDDLRLLDIISDLASVSIENARLYQRTNELAVTDGLTGLYVQRFFKDQLDIRVKEALRSGSTLSVLMIDLDYFKKYNDKYGHAAGDILLGRVAAVIKTCMEQGHAISRYGGEEFAAILLDMDSKKAFETAEKIRKSMEEAVFTVRRDEVRITVSIGISSFPKDGRAAAALLKAADGNLYKAKEGGRNLVCPHFSH